MIINTVLKPQILHTIRGLLELLDIKIRTKPKAVEIKKISEISRKMLAMSDPSAYITRRHDL